MPDRIGLTARLALSVLLISVTVGTASADTPGNRLQGVEGVKEARRPSWPHRQSLRRRLSDSCCLLMFT